MSSARYQGPAKSENVLDRQCRRDTPEPALCPPSSSSSPRLSSPYGDANFDHPVNSADLQIMLFDLNHPGAWDQGISITTVR